MDLDHERYMRLALEEATRAHSEGNLPVGAVIVRQETVLARGRNEVTSTFDVTAHAEMVAIRELSQRMRVTNPAYRANAGPLAGCVLYTTVEPCPMCGWAVCIAGLSGLVVGATLAQLDRTRDGSYTTEMLIAATGQSIEFVSGVLGDACLTQRLAR
jgi:tRNA(adenine34) deaminase